MKNLEVLNLANHIGGKKIGSKGAYDYNDPEYKILEPVVTTDMAKIGQYLEFRKPKTADDVSKLSGIFLKKTEELLWQLALAGVCFVAINKETNKDEYWIDMWFPGVMEMMVNHNDNINKYPQIAEAFEEYGRVRGPEIAGVFPVGTGPMRVIPIESAIDNQPKKASYEEISKYLNDHEVFSVSDCACRTVREVMGEGCGHLKEDICIQMGYVAEYYIRTGRGKKITREEAFKIIDKAEKNGLMHQISNMDGPGKAYGICNCCGCSCLSLRNANMFINNDMIRSNYVSKIDEDKCVACGECVEVCPVNALKLGDKICSDNHTIEYEKYETPRNTTWEEDKWNPNYRINRENVLETGTSPCKSECPAHISVQGYIKLASQGEYRRALELIKKDNPFPAVCGRICPRSCESVCTRGSIEDPIAIDDIKKFIAEQDLKKENRFVPRIKNNFSNKIAVIGSGPSGMSCAYYLAEEGYKVTVFEKEDVLGGMLTLGIPSFRLEKHVFNSEIEVLKEMGIEFITGVEIGKDISINQLRNQGFEAFYLAIGAQKGRKLNLEGEDAEGVLTGVEFLRDVNSNKSTKLEGNVIVIGGGNVAIDVARTVVRVGSDKVDMFCIESEEEMPALDDEIEEAISEGININNSWGPNKIIVEDGKVIGVEFKKCISVYDENNRFNPVFNYCQRKTVKADKVLISVGQVVQWGKILSEIDIDLNCDKTIKVDNFTLQSKEEDIFAGGDVATGPKFAIDAIALGKEAAISIHRYVQPGQSLILGRDRRNFKAFDKENINLNGFDNLPRQRIPMVDGRKAKNSFEDLRETFSEDQMIKETERCLGCGVTTVDQYMCVGCGACTNVCKFDAISLVKKYDSDSINVEELKPILMKNKIQRQGRIVVKNVKDAFRLKK